MRLNPKDYYSMSLSDFYLMYMGWAELRRSELYESWEQVRNIVLYSLHHPVYKVSKFFKLDKDFPNPYGKKKEPEKGEELELEDVRERLARWDKLDFKEFKG